MLALGRKAGERICIGDDIIVEVVSVGSKKAVIGIRAPRDVIVMREEVVVRSCGEAMRRTGRKESSDGRG